jgi:GNAT superfamily N-acetyltransferase
VPYIDRMSTGKNVGVPTTGSAVTIRRLDSSDYDDVVGLVVELTVEERYLRFLTRYPTYIGEWALSLTTPSDRGVALGAFESGDLVGVANYVVLTRPGYAEVALVVAHEQHRRGIGTALLKALGDIAKESGLNHFVADVLAENHLVRELLHDAGWQVTERRDGDLLGLEFSLQEPAS